MKTKEKREQKIKPITQTEFNQMRERLANMAVFAEMVGGDGHEEERDFAIRLYTGLLKAKTMLSNAQFMEVLGAMGIVIDSPEEIEKKTT